MEIKFVHVMRNPYDVINTMSVRDHRPLDRSIDKFFSLCDAVTHVKQRVAAADIYDVPWNRRLIESVQERLKRFSFLAGYAYDSDVLQPIEWRGTDPACDVT